MLSRKYDIVAKTVILLIKKFKVSACRPLKDDFYFQYDIYKLQMGGKTPE